MGADINNTEFGEVIFKVIGVGEFGENIIKKVMETNTTNKLNLITDKTKIDKTKCDYKTYIENINSNIMMKYFYNKTDKNYNYYDLYIKDVNANIDKNKEAEILNCFTKEVDFIFICLNTTNKKEFEWIESY